LNQWFRPCFAARNEFELATARGAGFTSFEQRSRRKIEIEMTGGNVGTVRTY
jgi:hypothetical protein